jgi:isopentenyl-diphosphate delta-isomerase
LLRSVSGYSIEGYSGGNQFAPSGKGDMAEENQPLTNRKKDHIRINLEEDVSSGLSTGLERYRFDHEALPEIDLDQVNLHQSLFGKKLAAPILISSMTGGSSEAAKINQTLAEAAKATGIALGLGSQRVAVEHPEQVHSFQVRKYAPNILLFANLGAVQLNYRYSIEECIQVVEMAEADALILHLNPLQEALQPEGDTRFGSLAKKIEAVCRRMPVPVVVKEVGWGISERTARLLANAGVAAIDVAGAGGTSWSQVEMYRIKDPHRAHVAAAFRAWGIPTSESIQRVRKAAPEMKIIASGGLRDGIDIAKSIALGAVLGGMAGPFLHAAVESLENTVQTIQEIQAEIQICMFSVGATTLVDLQNTSLYPVHDR